MRRLRAVAMGVVLAGVGLPAVATAADSIWWVNYGSPGALSFAALDGSAGGGLATPGLTLTYANGVAFDPAAGRAYIANTNETKGAGSLATVKLDGSGGSTLVPAGPGLSNPIGVSIDLAAGRVYFADVETNRIAWARLDGTGGATPLVTTGATVSNPSGVAVDPAAGRVYWANAVGDKISWANTNGAGGGDLTTAGATVKGPVGVAVDPAAGRIYWANAAGGKISWANLDGTGGADLNTTGATVGGARGVAIDAAAGRVYWANFTAKKISYARLDGTGGSDVATLTASVTGPTLPALLKRPTNTAAPAISGGPAVGSTLTCSDGTWAADLTPSFLFQAPAGLAYAWTRDDKAVAGATAKTLTADQAGAYKCTVTATNAAGSTPQASAASAVGGGGTPTPTPGPSPTPRPGPVAARISLVSLRGQTVTFRTSRAGTLLVRSPRDQFRSVSRKVSGGNVTVTLNLKQGASNQLRRRGRLTVPITATLKPGNGIKAGALKRTLTLKVVR